MVKKIPTAIILTTVFIDLMGFGIIIPILPSFATKKLSMSEFDIGIVIAAFSLVQFIVSPILGRLSDKIGRRPVILFSLFLTAASYALLSFANSFLILLLSRMLAGLGGGNIGVAQAYI
ncbi:MAG: MFS transporter, partial [Ignavibacteriales bacterium]|nr:MFS transporter [Ignavibacteriales bacterium]